MSREVIAYNPAEMFHLTSCYERFKSQITPTHSQQELLVQLVAFIRTAVFDLNLCSESKVRRLVGDKRLISLDTFVAAQTGVCRHFALATGYLIEKLLDEGFLEGKHHWIRATIPGVGRHAWNLLRSNSGDWLIDSYWGIVSDLTNPIQRAASLSLYGDCVIE